jgi:NADH-quinone oxidoreductase subunit E
VARLTADNVQRARDLMALYPQSRSALIPILHLLQEQDGWLTEDGMTSVADLMGLTPAEVYGTASFYDMLFTEPVGKHLVSICTNIACLLAGGDRLLAHAEETLGVKPGGTTEDGQFTLEEVECIALCGNAPCLAVNWRYFGDVATDDFDSLITDLRAGRLADTVPPHGVLCRVRRDVGLLADVTTPAPRPAATQAPPASPAPPAAVVQPEREAQPAGTEAVAAASGEAPQVESPPAADTAPKPKPTRAPRAKKGKGK